MYKYTRRTTRTSYLWRIIISSGALLRRLRAAAEDGEEMPLWKFCVFTLNRIELLSPLDELLQLNWFSHTGTENSDSSVAQKLWSDRISSALHFMYALHTELHKTLSISLATLVSPAACPCVHWSQLHSSLVAGENKLKFFHLISYITVIVVCFFQFPLSAFLRVNCCSQVIPFRVF